MKKPSKRLSLCLLFALLLILTWKISTLFTPQELEARLSNLGPWAPPVYIGLWIILPVFFFPVPVLALAGGLLFDLVRGSIYTFVGAMLNCSLMFLLARFVGREQVTHLIQKKLSAQWQARLNTAGGQQGFLLLIILRLIPAVPYNLINYTFGLTKMGFTAYLLGSALGIIPGTLAFINIGDKALDVTSPSFRLAILLLLLLLAATSLLGKRLFPSTSKSNEKKRNYNEE